MSLVPFDAQSPEMDTSAGLGARVLIAESNWHIAKDLQTALEGTGMEVIGPVATTAEARRLIGKQTPDLALVGVSLRDSMVWSLIERLHHLGARVVAVSGY